MGALSLASSRAHPRALSVSLPLSRSLSISGSASLSRAPSSLFHPHPARSLARVSSPVSHSPSFPFSLSLSLSWRSSRARRSSLLARASSPLSSVSSTARSPLASPLARRCFSFGTSLFSSIRITTLSRLARSSSDRPASPLVACIFAFFSLALSTPFPMLRRCLCLSHSYPLFFSPFRASSPSFPLIFFARGRFLSLTNRLSRP